MGADSCLSVVARGGCAGGNTVAAGMDDGCVRFFTWTSVGGLQYSKTLQKVDGRMLAVAWHPAGTTVVGGSSKGSIHVWEAGTSTELQCIELGRSSAAWKRTCA